MLVVIGFIYFNNQNTYRTDKFIYYGVDYNLVYFKCPMERDNTYCMAVNGNNIGCNTEGINCKDGEDAFIFEKGIDSAKIEINYGYIDAKNINEQQMNEIKLNYETGYSGSMCPNTNPNCGLWQIAYKDIPDKIIEINLK